MIPANRSLDATIRIKRADGVWVDITEFVKSVRPHRGDISSVGTGSSGVDAGVLQCEVVIVNDTENHFSPLDKNSSWNQLPDGSYAPLIWPNREIEVKVQTESPVAKFISDDLSQGTLTDVEVDAEGNLVLSVAGVDLSYTENTQADFATGTLSDVVATADGSLELAKTGSDLAYTEDTQADFSSGTLTDVVATSSGDLELVRKPNLVLGDTETTWWNDVELSTAVTPYQGNYVILAPGSLYSEFTVPESDYPREALTVNFVFCIPPDTVRRLYFYSQTGKNNTVIRFNNGNIESYDGSAFVVVATYQPNAWYWFKYRDIPGTKTAGLSIGGGSEQIITIRESIASSGDSTARLRFYPESNSVYLDGFSAIGDYVASGNRTTELDLSTVGTVNDSSIGWSETEYSGLSFDGVDDYVSIPNESQFEGMSRIEVEAEVRIPSEILGTAKTYIIADKYWDGTDRGWRLYAAEDDTIVFLVATDSVNDNIKATIPTSSYVDEFHVIKGVWDSSDQTIRLFIDGVEVATQSQAGSTVRINNSSVYIGVSYYNNAMTNYFNGDIRYVKISNQNGVISEWKLDEGTGTTAYDSVGSNDGTIYGATWFTSVDIETNLALDGVTYAGWQTCTNGGAIPGITSGTDLSSAKMLLRENLATSDPTVTPQLHRVDLAITSQYKTTGYRLAPPIPLDSVGVAKGSTISWTSTLNGQALQAETSLDGVNWDTPTNGGEIPGIADQDLSGKSLHIRESLTSDGTDTPRLESLGISILAGYNMTGIRLSPVYDISSVGIANQAIVAWQYVQPDGTSIEVETSVNSGAWKSVTNGDTIADITEGMDLTGATLQFKITEITADAEVRPSLEKLTCTVQGYKDGLWTIFQGYLGDSISMDGHQVSALCRDPSKRLEDCYIESAQAYGTEAGTPAETVLQEMLDNNLGTGVVTLYCPTSPGFMVTDYTVEYTSLWQAMKTLVQQFGWFLGYFTDSNGNFILCLIEPPRDKNQYTADLTLDYMDDFYDPSTLNISDADIRNVIIVTYRDKATNERKRVVLEDPDSIAQFGRKVMLIEESDTSEINTDEEARAMAAAALSDLKQISGTHKLPMPFVPTVDIFTGINRWDPRISSTVDFFGVESVEHTLDFQNHRFRTQVVGAGKVIGGRASWLDMQVRPGANEAIHAGQVLQGILDAGSAAIVAKGNGGYVVIDKNGQKFVAADGAITIEFNTETGEGFFAGKVVGAVYGE